MKNSAVFIISGPSTRTVGVVRGGGGTSRWRLSSSSVIVCNTRICNLTHQGAACESGPILLHPVRAAPCCLFFCMSAQSEASLFTCVHWDVVAGTQTYSKKAVDAVQEALTQAQKTHVLSQNIFEVTAPCC